jgi:hypothetical protein
MQKREKKRQVFSLSLLILIVCYSARADFVHTEYSVEEAKNFPYEAHKAVLMTFTGAINGRILGFVGNIGIFRFSGFLRSFFAFFDNYVNTEVVSFKYHMAALSVSIHIGECSVIVNTVNLIIAFLFPIKRKLDLYCTVRLDMDTVVIFKSDVEGFEYHVIFAEITDYGFFNKKEAVAFSGLDFVDLKVTVGL